MANTSGKIALVTCGSNRMRLRVANCQAAEGASAVINERAQAKPEIGSTALFLPSDASRSVAGPVLLVDGGVTQI